MNLFPRLYIYGWPKEDENCALASLLTGDPLLLIGEQGSAKSMAGAVIARALGVSFASYPADKADMEQYLGLLDIDALKNKEARYIETPNTIWGRWI